MVSFFYSRLDGLGCFVCWVRFIFGGILYFFFVLRSEWKFSDGFRNGYVIRLVCELFFRVFKGVE